MERKSMAPTLRDGMVSDLGGPRSAAFFDRAGRLIDWDRLTAALADLAPDQPAGGRPFWPLLVMLKCQLLQKWFGLSDPQLEEMLRDRLSFRRFVGLSLDDDTPDETTFCVFRERLRQSGKASELFDTVLASLRDKGLVLKEGLLVDATIIDAPVGTPRAPGASGGGTHSKDPAATYTRNHGTLRHGFKAHLLTDRRGVILDYRFDTARPHDSRHIDDLTATAPAGETIYADSAYRSAARADALARRRITDRIVHKRVRGQAELTAAQKRHNHACSGVRAMVEHPRAWMVKMGYTAARYRGLARNGVDFCLRALAYNLKRSWSLLGQGLSRPRPHRHNGLVQATG